MVPDVSCRGPEPGRRADRPVNHQVPLPLPHVNEAGSTSPKRLPPTSPTKPPSESYLGTLLDEPPLVPRFCPP
jgi:hypothetical protein